MKSPVFDFRYVKSLDEINYPQECECVYEESSGKVYLWNDGWVEIGFGGSKAPTEEERFEEEKQYVRTLETMEEKRVEW